MQEDDKYFKKGKKKIEQSKVERRSTRCYLATGSSDDVGQLINDRDTLSYVIGNKHLIVGVLTTFDSLEMTTNQSMDANRSQMATQSHKPEPETHISNYQVRSLKKGQACQARQTVLGCLTWVAWVQWPTPMLLYRHRKSWNMQYMYCNILQY